MRSSSAHSDFPPVLARSAVAGSSSGSSHCQGGGGGERDQPAAEMLLLQQQPRGPAAGRELELPARGPGLS